MNRFIAGAIAGTAGIALLLGGAGTFAVWTATTEVSPGNIKAGRLAVTADDAGTWVNTTFNDPKPVDADYVIVPGNKLKYTQNVTITASGNDLRAELRPDISKIVNGITGVTYDFSVASDDANVTVGTGNIVTVSGPGTAKVAVTIDVKFPLETTDVTGMGKLLNLNSVLFTLTQLAPTAPPVAPIP